MLFTGNYDHTVDSKNRLSIPSTIRSAMDPEVDGDGFYLSPGERPRSLALWPSRVFEGRYQRRAPDSIGDPGYDDYDLLYYSTATRLKPDKLGRISIPDWVLRNFELGRDVTIVGVGDHLEILNRDDYQAFLTTFLPRYAELRRSAFASARDARRSGSHEVAGDGADTR